MQHRKFEFSPNSIDFDWTPWHFQLLEWFYHFQNFRPSTVLWPKVSPLMMWGVILKKNLKKMLLWKRKTKHLWININKIVQRILNENFNYDIMDCCLWINSLLYSLYKNIHILYRNKDFTIIYSFSFHLPLKKSPRSHFCCPQHFLASEHWLQSKQNKT